MKLGENHSLNAASQVISADANYIGAVTASRKLFVYLLLSICVLALIPRLILGVNQIIQYDGYWHVFTATQNRWRLFVSEWKGDAHPPLYYILLRGCAKLGSYPLVYRLPSIFPGVLSVYAVGQIAKKIYRSRGMALLAAAAYGFSLTIIDLDCDVRGYSLSLLFILCAFYCLLQMLTGLEQQLAPAIVLFGVSCSLAILTEYMAIFFFFASLVILLILAIRFPEVRGRMTGLLHTKPFLFAISLSLPFAVMAWLYRVHVRFQPATQGVVEEFYWAKGTSMLDFVLRGLQNEANFLLPVPIDSSAICAVLTIAVIGTVIYLSFVRKAAQKQIASAALGLTLSGILLQLILASLDRRYPFGGYARQQSILFPFIVLTAFRLFDFLSSWLPPILRSGITLVAGLLITAWFFHSWNRIPQLRENLFTGEYKTFRENLPHSKAVYVDQLSLIGYFIQTHEWQWKFKQHYREPERIDEYRTVSPVGEQRVVMRNLDQWNFDLLKPETYATLAQLLRDSHLPDADVFYRRQASRNMDDAAIADEKDRFQNLAKAAGLSIHNLYYDGEQAYIRMSLQGKD